MPLYLNSAEDASASGNRGAANAPVVAQSSTDSTTESLPSAFYQDPHRALMERLVHAWALARAAVTIDKDDVTEAQDTLEQLVQAGYETFLLNNREEGRSLLELAAISESFAGAEAVCTVLPELAHEVLHERRHSLTLPELDVVLRIMAEMAP
jgi:hypothetical protein